MVPLARGLDLFLFPLQTSSSVGIAVMLAEPRFVAGVLLALLGVGCRQACCQEQSGSSLPMFRTSQAARYFGFERDVSVSIEINGDNRVFVKLGRTVQRDWWEQAYTGTYWPSSGKLAISDGIDTYVFVATFEPTRLVLTGAVPWGDGPREFDKEIHAR
jgi:hypothetical protein